MTKHKVGESKAERGALVPQKGTTGYQLHDIVNTTIQGDSLTELKKFPPECIDTAICSPPNWHIHDYKVEGQIGME